MRLHGVNSSPDSLFLESDGGDRLPVTPLEAFAALNADRIDHGMFRFTAEASFHIHGYDDGMEWTDPPFGLPDGHRHKIERDDEGRVIGFSEAASHSHSIADEEMMSTMSQAVAAYRARQQDDELFSIDDVEIFRTGKWNGRDYTERDLDDMVAAFDAVGYQAPVKLGHAEESGDPAYGWVAKLERVGERLVATLKDLPGSLFEAIRDHRYDHVSAEIYWNLERDGQTFRRALKAVALLGAEMPGVADLRPLRESLSFDGTAVAHTEDLPMPDNTKALEDARAALEAAQAQIATLTAQVEELTADDGGDSDAVLAVERLTAEVAALREESQRNAERARVTEIRTLAERVRVPSLRPYVASIMDAVTCEGGPEVVSFTARAGDETVTQNIAPGRVVEEFVDQLNRIAVHVLGERSESNLDDIDDDGDERSPQDRVDALVQKYAAENDVPYTDALRACRKNPANRELFAAYAAIVN